MGDDWQKSNKKAGKFGEKIKLLINWFSKFESSEWNWWKSSNRVTEDKFLHWAEVTRGSLKSINSRKVGTQS